MLDRALGILLRIRQEAALQLGDRQPQRGRRHLWKDEYLFALGVYGLSSAKYDYTASESGFALVSAGVAIAGMEQAKEDIRLATASMPAATRHAATRKCPYPSYHVPLAHSHRLWRGGRSPRNMQIALSILTDATRHFGHAIPLLRECALLLAESGRQDAALRMLEPLEDLGRVFRDEATLSLIGRTCKDLGDRALEDHPVPIREITAHPARQWYRTAYEHYLEAFNKSGGYYPGINAATLALLCGRHEESRRLAELTIRCCRKQNMAALDRDERFWVLVTEGEALLLMGRARQAADFYRRALSDLPVGKTGLVQSTYNQVCRLAWALGPAVNPVTDAFRNSRRRLRKGPLSAVHSSRPSRTGDVSPQSRGGVPVALRAAAESLDEAGRHGTPTLRPPAAQGPAGRSHREISVVVAANEHV
jgi:tetratricopeptide (TPR) repeat protein